MDTVCSPALVIYTGFVEELCKVNVNDCASITCSGNGQCVDGVNSFTCVCNSGFMGNLCETDVRGKINIAGVCLDYFCWLHMCTASLWVHRYHTGVKSTLLLPL